MMDCPLLRSCLFFNDQMSNMPGTAAVIKRLYCRGDNTLCARLIVNQALGREKVPSDLFPIEVDRAKKLLKKMK